MLKIRPRFIRMGICVIIRLCADNNVTINQDISCP